MLGIKDSRFHTDRHCKLFRLWLFSLRLIGSAMFGAFFNLVTRVRTTVIFGTLKDDSL